MRLKMKLSRGVSIVLLLLVLSVIGGCAAGQMVSLMHPEMCNDYPYLEPVSLGLTLGREVLIGNIALVILVVAVVSWIWIVYETDQRLLPDWIPVISALLGIVALGLMNIADCWIGIF